MTASSWITCLAVAAFAFTPFTEEPPVEELTAAFSAKVLASAVFVSHREVDEALQNTAIPFLKQNGLAADALTDIDVDSKAGTVTVTINGEFTRTAKYFGDQGCVVLPRGEDGVHFNPVVLKSDSPEAAATQWPMGDRLSPEPLPPNVDRDTLEEALDLVFEPDHHTAAFVVVHKGRIVAERYGEGADMHTQHESWSMGKSLTAILYGRLVIQEGPFDPFKPAPFELWRGDDRNTIQIADLFRMSSGLKFSSRGDKPATWDHAHPDHSLVYSGGINVFEFSVTRPVEHPRNTIGRYRNCDPLLVGYMIKKAVEARGENYLAWPQKILFDKLGIRNITLEPDPYGNFIMTGFEYGSGRDWARLGMLMLQDGMWQGERLLPEGFVKFVTTPAAAWKNGEYGGLVWLNTQGNWNLPKSAYRFAGHGTQHVYVVPTHDLVIVRMGHLRGSAKVNRPLNEAVGRIVEAIDG